MKLIKNKLFFFFFFFTILSSIYILDGFIVRASYIHYRFLIRGFWSNARHQQMYILHYFQADVIVKSIISDKVISDCATYGMSALI